MRQVFELGVVGFGEGEFVVEGVREGLGFGVVGLLLRVLRVGLRVHLLDSASYVVQADKLGLLLLRFILHLLLLK